MNAPLPMNATSAARPSVLPDAWIEKCFQKFEDFYGSKWAAQYGSFPRDRVKMTWAEELAGFADKPESIGRALKNLGQFPPTLPEFQAMCRDAARSIGDKTKALPHKQTTDDHERIKSAAQAAIGAMKSKVSDGIDRHWATHPRSAMQLRFIFDAAKKDSRFLSCIEEMVEKGICTEGGHLLMTYRNVSFVNV